MSGRQHHQDEMHPIIEAWTVQYDHYDAARLLQKAGVTAAPTLDAEEVMHDPHLNARGFIAKIDHPEVGEHPISTVPWKMDSSPPPAIGPAPLLGQHTGEILRQLLGLSEGDVEHLAAIGAIS